MLLSDVVGEFGKPVSAEPNAHLFRQGDINRNFYVVQTGLLKAYYLSESGRESIKSFLIPGDMIGSLSAIRKAGECSFSLVSLKPCKLIEVSFERVFEASRSNPELAFAVAEFLMAFGMKKEQREYELLCLSAEERYRRLIADRPELVNAVQQSDIALYLGITPVGLSRIKKRVEQDR